MFRKLRFLMAFFLLSNVLCATRISTIQAAGTIYIRADGSIEPQTAPISSLDNVTYIFTGNINASIVVERSNTVIDGAGYMVYGTGTGNGISLQNLGNVTIENAVVMSFYYGIYFVNVSNSRILVNTVTSNSYDGIFLVGSTQNTIQGNYVVSNGNDGVKLVQASNNNIVSENRISANNDDGVQTDKSTYNSVIGNNLTTNVKAGINTGYSSYEVIRANNITGNQYGVRLVNATYEDVQMNYINGNGLCGIWLDYSSNDSISYNNVTNNYDGFYLHSSSRNEIFENDIAANTHYGFGLSFSPNNEITNNSITTSSQGIRLTQFSDSNIIYANTVADNADGIFLSSSSRNNIQANNIINNGNGVSLLFASANSRLYHNNFINNTNQASTSSFNYWDNGVEGNYWSDYTPHDYDDDGIGLAHLINGTNVDNNPLLGTFSSFKAALDNYVNVISNSTILDFQSLRSPTNITIKMIVQNSTSTQTAGFSRICIPYSMMTEPFNVTINGTAPHFANYTVFDNSTHRWIYFNYNHSILEVIIQGIETTPPEISLISPESVTYATSDVPLVFTVDETASWMGYSIDGQANVTLGGNTTLMGLSEGLHSIVVFANDTFGNLGASVGIEFSVDTLPPTIGVLSPENMTYQTGSIMLTFSINEPVSWMGYSLNGQANATVLGNTTLLGLPDGVHSVLVYANDTLGNMGSSNIVYFSVDTKPPTIGVLSPENMTYQTDSIMLTFTLDEPTSWVGYSLDGQANTTILGNTTLLGLSDGNHNVVVYAVDASGNPGSSAVTYFSVDATPPDITSVSQDPPEDNVLPYDLVNVNATIVDGFSGVDKAILNYTTNNGTWFSVEMSHLEGDIWNAVIPGFPYGTTVNYTISAIDNLRNSITSEDLAYTLQYNVVPEFPAYIAFLLLATTTLFALVLRRSKRVRT